MKHFTGRIQAKINKVRHSPDPVQCSSLVGSSWTPDPKNPISSPCPPLVRMIFFLRVSGNSNKIHKVLKPFGVVSIVLLQCYILQQPFQN